MADHKHGEMDTQVQESTYDTFIKCGIWSIVAVIFILIFMAMFAS